MKPTTNTVLSISDINVEELKEWLLNYINKKCIIRAKDGHVLVRRNPKKPPGPWQFYLRNGLFDAEFSTNVGKLFVHQIHSTIGHFNFQISGTETGAYPMLMNIPLVAIQYGIKINAFVVRKTPKAYGLLNIIEGVPNNLPIMIVDDLCNSGKTMNVCYNTINKEYNNTKTFFPLAYSIIVPNETRKQNPNILPAYIKNIGIFKKNQLDVRGTLDHSAQEKKAPKPISDTPVRSPVLLPHDINNDLYWKSL